MQGMEHFSTAFVIKRSKSALFFLSPPPTSDLEPLIFVVGSFGN